MDAFESLARAACLGEDRDVHHVAHRVRAAALLTTVVTLVGGGSTQSVAAETQAQQDTRWHQIIEAGGSIGEACRIDRENRSYHVRSRYSVPSDSEYEVRFQIWTKTTGHRQVLDDTGFVGLGAHGGLAAATVPKAFRGKRGAWQIRITLKGAGWQEWQLHRSQIRRC